MFTKKIIRNIRCLGLVIVVLALLFNPLVIRLLIGPAHKIQSVPILVKIILLELLAAIIGISTVYKAKWIYKKRKELILLIITIIICLTLILLTKNIVNNASTAPSPNYMCLEIDPYIGWDATPSCQKNHTNEEFNTTIIINNQHARSSKEYSLYSEKYRIAFIGDSFTWGYGVNENERFTDLLQQKLGDKYDIMNFGIPGYTAEQELLKLKRDVMKFRPKMVIINFYYNDIQDILVGQQDDIQKPTFIVSNDSIEPPTNKDNNKHSIYSKIVNILNYYGPASKIILRRIAAKTEINFLNRTYTLTNPYLNLNYFYEYKVSKYSQFQWTLIEARYSQLKEESIQNKSNEAIDINRKVYEQLNTFCQENNITLIIVYHPGKLLFIPESELAKVGYDKNSSIFYTSRIEMSKIAKELNVTYIDLTDFISSHGGLENYFVRDAHYNVKGNKNAAEYIYQKLTEFGYANDANKTTHVNS
jgi:lysophospholipase L1-like esterase